MSVTDYAVTRADFDRCNWESALAESHKKECMHYHSVFARRFAKAQGAGDAAAVAVFAILTAISGIELRADDADQPFGPGFSSRAGRGTAPCDISDVQYSVLRELAPSIVDPEMCARVCDLLWTMKQGSHELARAAVRAYIDAARACEDPVNWVPCEERARRAVALGKSLGGGRAV